MSDAADDAEVVEIFVEEAGEVFENIDNYLPIWRDRPTDRNALTEIRRGFHTLKGSGRMVNALDLSEVAWKIENLLNRLLDDKVQFSDTMVELVASARSLIQKMLDAFKNQRPSGAEGEVETLMARADALAAGQPIPTPAQTAVAAAGPGDEERLELDRAELERRFERIQQRADEALHRSEVALQHARRITAHIQTIEGEAQDRVGRTEVNRIIERVNLLAREVLDLRRDAKRPQALQPPNPREIGQLVDHRLRERMAPMERQRNELDKRLEEALDAAAASRRLAWWALALSTLVGGGAIALLLTWGPTWGLW